jgi:hypothetical protein
MFPFTVRKWPSAFFMGTLNDLDEYRIQLREDVCSHCVERRPNAPPCGPVGKGCGIERHLEQLVEICRNTDSNLIDPYIEQLHELICASCDYKDSSMCPCPLDYLLQLAVEAVEKVEQRRATRQSA